MTEDVHTQLANRKGLGMHSVQVLAASPAVAPPRAGDPSVAYYNFDRSSVVDGDGNMVPGARNALCSARDAIPNGAWIYLQVRYKQNLWIFGQRDVTREALVISHNLNIP